MPQLCPCCGQSLPEPDRVLETVESLKRVCIDAGITVWPDNLIREAAVARLLCRAEGTVRNWRSEGRIPFKKIRGRVMFDLQVVADLRNSESFFTNPHEPTRIGIVTESEPLEDRSQSTEV